MTEMISRGEMRRALSRQPDDQVWRSMLGWSRTLAPFWFEAIDRFAAVAAIPERRHLRCRTAAQESFERMDGWWFGRAELVKARRDEVDSAISLVLNTAHYNQIANLIQAPTAQHVGSALRVTLHVASGIWGREQLPSVVAGFIYDLACARTLFPGDPAALLQHVPPRFFTDGTDYCDNHHLLFVEPANLFDLRAEADAVLAEAQRIWLDFDIPQAWDMPSDIWTRSYPGTFQSMHFGSMHDFHAR